MQKTYFDLASESFLSQPDRDLYIAFAEVSSDLAFSEADNLIEELEYFHKLYFNLKKAEGLNFSEQDYSFSGVMNFIKKLSNHAADGMARHNDAIAQLDPGKLANRAYDFLSNVSSNIDGKIAQQQYRSLLGENDSKSGAEKLQQFIIDGWDRHNKSLGKSDPQIENRKLLEKLKNNRLARQGTARGQDLVDYFQDEPSTTQDDPWEGETPFAKKEQNSITSDNSMNYQKALPPGQDPVDEPPQYNTRAMEGFKPTQKTYDEYSKSYRNKKNKQLGDRLKEYMNDNYSEMPVNKYTLKYLNALDEINNTSNPKAAKYWGEVAAVNEALMCFTEAYEQGNKSYTDALAQASLDLVVTHEGMSYSESNPSLREVISKAALYNFSESLEEDYAENQMPDNDYAKKIRELKNKIQSNGTRTTDKYNQHKADLEEVWGDKKYAEAEEEENSSTMEQLEEMFDKLSDAEKQELMALLSKSKASTKNKKEQDDNDDDNDNEYSDCSSDRNQYSSDSSYSEALAKKDQNVSSFIDKCKLAFSEFNFINEQYNTSAYVYSEEVNYDFSEWMDSFRKANSASFNLFGNRCHFNGKLPSDIKVVPTPDSSEVAWEVLDGQNRFVTYSGIPEFKQLAYSENFTNVYCKESQGSTLKSDRIARVAFCDR